MYMRAASPAVAAAEPEITRRSSAAGDSTWSDETPVTLPDTSSPVSSVSMTSTTQLRTSLMLHVLPAFFRKREFRT